MADSESTAIHPDVAPAAFEVVIVKRRVGVFTYPEREMILRAQGSANLILTGVTTSRVVLSTAGKAFHLDYRHIVVKDYCADPDPDSKTTFQKKVLQQHAIDTSSSKTSNQGVKL
ncbi:isochorismatase family protein [Klebsiella pneumoniae]|nr:isochorismatase family protein [Klebsiella pneumoniae]